MIFSLAIIEQLQLMGGLGGAGGGGGCWGVCRVLGVCARECA